MSSPADDRPCQRILANGSCYNNYDGSRQITIDILLLNPNSPNCPSAPKTLLIIFAYNMIYLYITLCFSLVRRFSRVRYWYGEVQEKPRDFYIPVLLGSMLIQLAFTVASGLVLSAEDLASDNARLTMLWFARPLPTVFALPLVWFSGTSTDSTELAMADFLYRLISVGGFGLAAQTTTPSNHISPPSNGNFTSIQTRYVPLVRGGSAIGILTFLISFAFLVAQALGSVRHFLWAEWKRSWPTSLVYFIIIHIMYTLGSWLVWAGLLNSVPNGFCPTDKAFGKLAGIWIGAAIADNLWRSFSLLLSIGDEDHCPRWIRFIGSVLDAIVGFFFDSRE